MRNTICKDSKGSIPNIHSKKNVLRKIEAMTNNKQFSYESESLYSATNTQGSGSHRRRVFVHIFYNNEDILQKSLQNVLFFLA